MSSNHCLLGEWGPNSALICTLQNMQSIGIGQVTQDCMEQNLEPVYFYCTLSISLLNVQRNIFFCSRTVLSNWISRFNVPFFFYNDFFLLYTV